MTDRPNWGHGPNPPVPVFTEAEIRSVMDDHYPRDKHCDDNAPACSCGPVTVRRTRCFYCAAKVPENWRETKHKRGCKAEASGFRDMGVTMQHYPEFTVDHLIEQLKESRERAASISEAAH